MLTTTRCISRRGQTAGCHVAFETILPATIKGLVPQYEQGKQFLEMLFHTLSPQYQQYLQEDDEVEKLNLKQQSLVVSAERLAEATGKTVDECKKRLVEINGNPQGASDIKKQCTCQSLMPVLK